MPSANSPVTPVKVTDFTITEDAFDSSLNPIRARVSLGLRVLTVTDLGFSHKGGTLFMAYLQQKERMAARAGTISRIDFEACRLIGRSVFSVMGFVSTLKPSDSRRERTR